MLKWWSNVFKDLKGKVLLNWGLNRHIEDETNLMHFENVRTERLPPTYPLWKILAFILHDNIQRKGTTLSSRDNGSWIIHPQEKIKLERNWEYTLEFDTWKFLLGNKKYFVSWIYLLNLQWSCLHYYKCFPISV